MKPYLLTSACVKRDSRLSARTPSVWPQLVPHRAHVRVYYLTSNFAIISLSGLHAPGTAQSSSSVLRFGRRRRQCVKFHRRRDARQRMEKKTFFEAAKKTNSEKQRTYVRTREAGNTRQMSFKTFKRRTLISRK